MGFLKGAADGVVVAVCMNETKLAEALARIGNDSSSSFSVNKHQKSSLSSESLL